MMERRGGVDQRESEREAEIERQNGAFERTLSSDMMCGLEMAEERLKRLDEY